MYTLIFKKKNTKRFEEALTFAKELGAEFDGGTVVLNIEENRIIPAYSMIRYIFGYVQNWKGTSATFNGKKAHPYQFILHMHRIGECYDKSNIDKSNCGNQWSCKKIDLISWRIGGDGIYTNNKKFWYNFGAFKGDKWVINKSAIRKELVSYVQEKGIDLCPFYSEQNVVKAVSKLPDYIIPDDITFRIHFEDSLINHEVIQERINIRHLINSISEVENQHLRL